MPIAPGERVPFSHPSVRVEAMTRAAPLRRGCGPLGVMPLAIVDLCCGVPVDWLRVGRGRPRSSSSPRRCTRADPRAYAELRAFAVKAVAVPSGVVRRSPTGNRGGRPRRHARVSKMSGGDRMAVRKTPVEIDDEALAAAAKVLGTTTKKDTVNAALREVSQRFLRLRALEQLGEMADQGEFDEFLGTKDAYRR